MAQNAMTEKYEEIELFGKPGLFSNFRIDRSSVPQGWFCYDLRGSDYDPGQPIAVEPLVAVNHAATVLMPEPVEFKKDPNRRMLHGGLNFLGYELTLREFCEEHGLPQPNLTTKYDLHPASPEEAGLFYAQTPEENAELGCIGHVRMDFGRNGTGFWHTWHPGGPEEWNSPEFKSELNNVIDELRRSVLKDFVAMERYCHDHGGKIEGGICTQNYGYTVETERYRYCLRCNPVAGDYNAYLTCYDKQIQEMNQARSEDREPIAINSLAALKRAIKPGAELMATYHANHPEIVGLVRIVTEVQSNAFYSVIKDQPDHRFSTCNYGKGFRSDFEKASAYQFDGTSIKVLDARIGDGSVLYEFEVYAPEMTMGMQEESEESFTMTMGGM